MAEATSFEDRFYYAFMPAAEPLTFRLLDVPRKKLGTPYQQALGEIIKQLNKVTKLGFDGPRNVVLTQTPRVFALIDELAASEVDAQKLRAYKDAEQLIERQRAVPKGSDSVEAWPIYEGIEKLAAKKAKE